MEDKKQCTGCMSCQFFCPTKAIEVIEYENTFIRKICEEKCIHCGKCKKMCHVCNSSDLNFAMKAYVAESKSNTYRKHGASGGIASTIYRFGIDNNYKCIGVTYENGYFLYKILTNTDDILKCSGSKYVLSHIEKLYEELDSLIQDDLKIIFIGLPCHCAAMKKILTSEKVVWVDLVCNGVCAEKKMWDDLEKNNVNMRDVNDIRFREKNNQYGLTVRDGRGRVVKKIEKNKDVYMQDYEQRKNVYEHCLNCRYAQRMRVGDITLKDYVWKYGISNVLINTEKGNRFWNKFKRNVYAREYAIEKVIQDDERIR